MYTLKTLSKEAIPSALGKAEHYRLLNEGRQLGWGGGQAGVSGGVPLPPTAALAEEPVCITIQGMRIAAVAQSPAVFR